MWSHTLVHDNMKSIIYHTLWTMSENAYVKCRLWNHIVSIFPPCHFALDMAPTLIDLNLIFYLLESIMMTKWWLDNPTGRTLKASIWSIPSSGHSYQIGWMDCMWSNWSSFLPFWMERACYAVLWPVMEKQHSWSQLLCSWRTVPFQSIRQ